MALNIKNAAAEHLAHELAELTGESLTEAVTVALRDRIAALGRRRDAVDVYAAVAELQEFVRSTPSRDERTLEEILGYDAFGLPG